MRLAIVVVLLVLAAPARADIEARVRTGAAGVALVPELAYLARYEAQWAEGRDNGGLYLGRVGFELWRAPGTSWGFDVPMGISLGGGNEKMWTTLGAGVGVLAIESHDDDGDAGVGISPFASATVGTIVGDRHVIELDLRATRRVLAGMPDATSYTVSIVFGK